MFPLAEDKVLDCDPMIKSSFLVQLMITFHKTKLRAIIH